MPLGLGHLSPSPSLLSRPSPIPNLEFGEWAREHSRARAPGAPNYCVLLRVRLAILLLHPPHSTPGIPSMNMATCCVPSSVLLELAVEPWQSAAVLAELAELAEVGAAAAVLAELSASCVQTKT